MDLEGQHSAAEQALQQLQQAVQASVAKPKKGKEAKANAERIEQIKDCERLAQRLKNCTESYRLETRDLSEADKASHEVAKRLLNLENGLKQCRTEIEWKRTDAEAEMAKHASADRAGGGGLEVEELSGPLTLDQAVSLAEQTQEAGKKSLGRSLQTALQAEQVGIATLGKMHAQEEQMARIGEDMEDVKANIKRSKKLVGQIARSAASDRCIQALCVLIAVTIMVMIVLAVTGHDGGKFAVPDQVRQVDDD